MVQRANWLKRIRTILFQNSMTSTEVVNKMKEEFPDIIDYVRNQIEGLYKSEALLNADVEERIRTRITSSLTNKKNGFEVIETRPYKKYSFTNSPSLITSILTEVTYV